MEKPKFESGQLVKAAVGDSYFEELNSVTINHIALESRYGLKSYPPCSKHFVNKCLGFQTSFSKKRNGTNLLNIDLGEIPIYYLRETYGEETYERIQKYCEANLEGLECYFDRTFKNLFNRYYFDNILYQLIEYYKTSLSINWFILGVPTIKVNDDDGILNKINEIRIDVEHLYSSSRGYIDQTDPNDFGPLRLSYYFPDLTIKENQLLPTPKKRISFSSDLAHGDMGIVVDEYELSYRPIAPKILKELVEDKDIELSPTTATFLFDKWPAGKYYRIMHRCRSSLKHSETLVHESNLVLCSSDNQINGEEWKNHTYLPTLPPIDNFTQHDDSLHQQPQGIFQNRPCRHRDLISAGITKYWYRDMYQLFSKRSMVGF